MAPVSLDSDELSKELVAPDDAGERVIIYQEIDESGVATGRSATFADIEFRGLGYADLIGHTLGTPLVMPLRLANARVIQSNLLDLSLETQVSVSAVLDSPYSSRALGLVRDGWLPSGIAFSDSMIVLPDRCVFSELAGRFRAGEKTKLEDKDFLDFLIGRKVRINPLLYVLEGNLKRNPDDASIEHQFDVATEIINAALPLAQIVPIERGSLEGVRGLIRDSEAGMVRKQEFLTRLAPKLRAPIAARRVNEVWDEVLATAKACEVPVRSLVVLAALSAVCVPNGKSPAKGLLKFNVRKYTVEDAYNALADLRSLEVLMHLFAAFPDEKILLCTGDKDLVLFWAGIRPSEFAMVNGVFSAKFSPVEDLLPNVTSERKAAYFSAVDE
ncbi:hypothetical protein [Pseudomonas fluorescens]|uniref:Uncharacterized protein n=1 Tax=Pseudomonas fluorescens TaxID=294 RepID=A0A423LM42_PSEFL|nr:hypothetical protein [Pseudomonas fluorescens]RON69364.1 hypothetical protein BK671_07970 [Pseudomonas fluorescens]